MWRDLYKNGGYVTHFDGFGVNYSIMSGYFCIRDINFMLKSNGLLHFTLHILLPSIYYSGLSNKVLHFKSFSSAKTLKYDEDKCELKSVFYNIF